MRYYKVEIITFLNGQTVTWFYLFFFFLVAHRSCNCLSDLVFVFSHAWSTVISILNIFLREFPFSSAWILKNQFFLCAMLSWHNPHWNSSNMLRRQWRLQPWCLTDPTDWCENLYISLSQFVFRFFLLFALKTGIWMTCFIHSHSIFVTFSTHLLYFHVKELLFILHLATFLMAHTYSDVLDILWSPSSGFWTSSLELYGS